MKVFLYFIGRGGDPRCDALASEYVRRASRWAKIEMREVRTRHSSLIARHREATKIALDPVGQSLTSPRFAKLVQSVELQASDLVFLIGGADGLPEEWRKGADLLLSLGSMTLPHGLARVVVAEQIYRAFATLRGHPYPR